ncbi:molybdopterin cofactor-binding domain-containing protein [Streptomyces virginiae]|uniref:molybdopterin cofactor-binding domain-containing protein n=1 Tax=Streptomyces virginiae TaxID=1961 RepID=UPI0036EE73CB
MSGQHDATGRSRRSFLTYLVAAPTLALVTRAGVDGLAPQAAHAVVPSLPAVADVIDLGDLFILAGAPTSALLALAVEADGTVRFRLPREEVGQGLTTAVAMLVAEELDAPLADVRVELDDARPELLFNQLTGSSNSIRSLYGPVRQCAATARARLVAAAAQRAVLDKVATEGNWGRAMEPGRAQGIAFHEEYKSRTACLVEIDVRDPQRARVTKAVIAVDVGLPVNPRGLEAQMIGGLTDAISTTLRAGLHIDKGLPLEGSYSQFHWAQQRDTPRDVRIFVLPATGTEPGGAGELGVPAAVGAIANAWARATGSKPRSFPLDFDVDFTPYPR